MIDPLETARKPSNEPGGVRDVAVVGAGIVGLAAALALAGRGLRVALLEEREPARRRGRLGFDLRTVALTPPSMDFIATLGEPVADAAPIDEMHVWELEGTAAVDFQQNAPLAWVVENSSLVERMWEMARQRVEVRSPARVEELAHSADRITLAGEGLCVAARLVVAADGSRSRVGELAGAKVRRGRALRHAVVTIVRCRDGHGGVAFQRFGADGPAALLPLTDARHMAVIWSVRDPAQERLMAMDDDEFRRALDEETESVVGIEAVDRRATFPLSHSLVEDCNPHQRVLALGDAARTLHPMAGQGVNLGLEDVRAMLAHLGEGDPGQAGAWRAFSAGRRRRSKMMIALQEALLAVYGARGPLAGLIRNAGVRLVDRSETIKAQLIREAMGMGALSAVDLDRAGRPS